MAKKYYNGNLLPDIEAVWDKTTYPYACIHLFGRTAFVAFTDKVGYIEGYSPADGYMLYNYTLGLTTDVEYDPSKVIYAKVYVVALDETGVELNADTYPGINMDSWVEDEWEDVLGTGNPVNSYYSLPMGNNGPHWTNTTLYDADGNLFLEASDPVAYFDLRSWLTGYALGLCGKPLPFSKVQKEPVAYLYNGVRLPKLPETGYQYAIISKTKDDYTLGLYDEYVLFVTNQQPIKGTGSITFPAGTYRIYEYRTTEAFGWVEEANENDKYINAFYDLFWCNEDILNENGSVYFAASEPIPVYE